MRKEKRKSILAHSPSVVHTGKIAQVQDGAPDLVKQCPCCNQIIEPKVVEYLPRPGTYKQYRCKHCSAWLTIDLRSRVKLFVLGSLGLFRNCFGKRSDFGCYEGSASGTRRIGHPAVRVGIRYWLSICLGWIHEKNRQMGCG